MLVNPHDVSAEAPKTEVDIRLSVAALCKSYEGRGSVLRDVSFQVLRGTAVALIGGNGSGKSTLLRCCLRLIEPDRGEIVFLRRKICTLNKAQLRRLRSRVGLVFQRHNLVPRLSVLTNVIHGAMGRAGGVRTWWQSLAPKDLRAEAMACLEKVGLPHLASSRADQLSGGESQRIAIARALMQRPDFMMADEPVASLDPKVGREVMELFVDLIQRENITLFYVSHDLDHALQYSEQLIALRKGRLVMNDRSGNFTKSDLNEIYH
ncbi:MAG: ATP-binding cassette domain-containing protein [Desulfosarcina sp.]|nr:ATP-binding cassette domain-containing protein [Desulfobacterales bacterium]